MKTDRLYAMTVYLLNHGKTSASALAKQFEVSVRTVQRDIDALCRAGIPVAAETGANGGYYLAEGFRMDAHTATKEDYSRILTALKGYATAMNDPQIASAMEKITALGGKGDDGVVLDFSVLNELDSALMGKLKDGISRKKKVRFTYTNGENVTRVHTVEPVAVVYRWYAWYLLAYSLVKGDYRTYKLVRMGELEVTEEDQERTHGGAEAILTEIGRVDGRTPVEIKVRCRPEARARAIEYLNGRITAEYEDGGCDMTLYVMESEHLWFGTLLSLGDGIEILEPERVRRRIVTAAEGIVSLYGKL